MPPLALLQGNQTAAKTNDMNNLYETTPLCKSPFAEAARDFAAAGLYPVPCKDKKPSIYWARLKYRPSERYFEGLASKGAENIGILTGKRSGVFIVDIDGDDLVPAMLERFGEPLVITQTPRGTVHLWYAWNGERCGHLRPEFDVDLKGEGGFSVEPPSYRREGVHAGKEYQFIRGSLLDVARLPVAKDAGQKYLAPPEPVLAPTESVMSLPAPPAVNSRNVTLFHAVKEAAPRYDDDGLRAFAHRFNMTNNANQPKGLLPEARVEMVVASVLKYKAEGKLLLKGCEPTVRVPLSVIELYADHPEALWLDALLHAKHDGRRDTFALSVRPMSKTLSFGERKLRHMRDAMLEQGRLETVKPTERYHLPDGTVRNTHATYRLSNRGSETSHNITRHPLCGVRAVEIENSIPSENWAEKAKVVSLDAGPDLFGTVDIPANDFEAWHGGVLPEPIRLAVERKRRAYGLTHADLAMRIGISRPQTTNGLRGRFGFGAEAAEKLKEFLTA